MIIKKCKKIGDYMLLKVLKLGFVAMICLIVSITCCINFIPYTTTAYVVSETDLDEKVAELISEVKGWNMEKETAPLLRYREEAEEPEQIIRYNYSFTLKASLSQQRALKKKHKDILLAFRSEEPRYPTSYEEFYVEQETVRSVERKEAINLE